MRQTRKGKGHQGKTWGEREKRRRLCYFVHPKKKGMQKKTRGKSRKGVGSSEKARVKSGKRPGREERKKQKAPPANEKRKRERGPGGLENPPGSKEGSASMKEDPLIKKKTKKPRGRYK